ncbi:E3 ubiquitin-protein ligase RHF2A-like isoform X2 [Primulina huaijiensis]|uniref:E3 ubiquitin-protein ligase RHF2A-like isoform X2 n=1 Tax=Primulina huaijiensis TaxID=1492673 RepID=UPI003CC71465
MEEEKMSENHLTSAAAFVEGGIQEACDDACSICLEDFSDGDPSTVTSCKHEFHLQCILEWCQRSSQCPMCWQPISLKDPGSQELLDAVEHERNMRMNPPRTTTIFRHPTLGDFELQHFPVSASESELEERIIQHLAAAAAMGRARQLARREGQRSRASAQGRPHFLVFSSPDASPTSSATSSVDQRDVNDPAPTFMIAGPNSPFMTVGEDSAPVIARSSSAQADQFLTSASSAGADQQGTFLTNRSPAQTSQTSSQDRAGSSDFQSFSESVKTRVGAWSMKCKESITKSTRGWKEKLFNRNSSIPEPSHEVHREVDQVIAPVSRLMDHLEISEVARTNIATVSNSTLDSSSSGPTEQRHIAEMGGSSSLNEDNSQAPCAASASN